MERSFKKIPNTGLDVFDTTIEKTNELLSNIEQEFDWQGRRHQSYQALRTVLHSIRDRLPVHESVNFAAQLPMLLKGIYYDGWDPEKVPTKMNREEFISQIRQRFVFDIDVSIESMIGTIAGCLFEIIDPGEVQKILNTLPAEIRELLSGEVGAMDIQ